MVSTSSLQADSDTRRPRFTLEKAKVVNLSKQLQIRLQYARLKVEHGWQRQSLNEVENLYFHHSTLKGKSKASSARSAITVAPSVTSPTTNGSSPRGYAASKKITVNMLPEPGQDTSMTAVAPPPPAVVVSPPPTTSSPFAQGTSTPPHSSTPVAEDSSSSHTTGATPAAALTSDAARSASFQASVLSAFSQNYTVSQQQLSHAATIDFSTLSPFVTASPFVSPGVSLATPSSFVAPQPFPPPPQQTLAYPPSPFAPPPQQPTPVPPAAVVASTAAPHFPASSYPMVIQPSSMSVPLSTFPPFPAVLQSQPPPPPPPSPTPAPATTPAPNSNPTPDVPPSQRAPPRHTPTPVQPAQTKPTPAPTPPSSSTFRPSRKTFDIPTAPGPPGGTAGAGTLAVQGANTTLLTYDSFWSSHVSAAASAGGGGVGGWRRAAAGGTSTLAASTGTATGATSGGAKR
ncbi:hypothetical protein EI94DRAFT_1836272 [Lactarius quietus]|nr:hypothetical protein EI94DRAFT_1836272 [Lactarius quietus]